MFKEYNKIETPFNMDTNGTKKLIDGDFRSKAVEELQDIDWEWTEKVDGTNIRVCWDGHKVTFAGRTDKAKIPSHLLDYLTEKFGGEINEELFEQKFGEKEVILFGEGYGQKIQTNGYRNDVSFILFDVMINGCYLLRESIEEAAKAFNVEVVPIIKYDSVNGAIAYIKGHPKSIVAKNNGYDCYMEGVVGKTKSGLCDRSGKRIIVKVKWCDFNEN